MTRRRGKKPATSVSDVDLDVLEDMLSFYIRSINLTLSRDLDERLAGLDVAKGTGKITTLLLVDSHPGIRPSVIATLIMKDRSAMGRLIDFMESHGLISRRTSPKDTRAQELYITEKGHELAETIRPIVTKQSEDFFAGMPAEEQQQILAILKRHYHRLTGRD